MNTICQRILVLVVALASLSPAVRSQQSQRASRPPTQEDRIKKLEDRADAAEKAASSAAIEKDYITRVQKDYESYYHKALYTPVWTLGIMGLILTGVFVLVARFCLNMIEQQTKMATAAATVQMRNEYSRAVAKEAQKLWDTNASDLKKLKEAATAQLAELTQNLKDRSEFQMQFVQGLAAGLGAIEGDVAETFRNALRTYASGKSRNLIETRLGAATVRAVFESLKQTHGDNYVEKAREELADRLYDGLAEELALAALQSPWLTPHINERVPAAPEPPPPAPAATAEARPVAASADTRATAPIRETPPADSDVPVGEESDSCRLLNT